MLRFGDGVTFDTSGKLRPERRSDGWYAVGEGLLCSMDSREDAEAFIADFYARREERNRRLNRSGFKAGDRVVFPGDTDVYPHALIAAGSRGTVVAAGTDAFAGDSYAVAIKLDDTYPGLAAWDNEYHWNPENWSTTPEAETPPFKKERTT